MARKGVRDVEPVREAEAGEAGRLRRAIGRNLAAGLAGALAAMPHGLTSGALAGVNPVFGLYAATIAPIVGGLLSSTRLMIVSTTSTGALLAAAGLRGLSGEEKLQAMMLLTLFAGLIMMAAGLLRLGRVTHFVSHSVMIGFLTAIAVRIVLAQLDTLVGYDPERRGAVANALVVLANPQNWGPGSLATGGLAAALMLSVNRTRIDFLGALVGVAVPSFLVLSAGWDQVQLVRDVGGVPSGLPALVLPDVSAISWELVLSALAIAAVMLAQGAGVSETAAMHHGGPRVRLSRDFLATGIANAASSFVRGIPVGGSLSATSISISTGAKGRLAAVFLSLWMVLIVLVFSGLIRNVAMPALAALLIIAALRTIRPGEAAAVWHAGWPSRLALAGTFGATLVMPVASAVGIGVLLSAVLTLVTSSVDVSVVELVPRPDGMWKTQPPPKRLPDRAVTVLQVYGSLFYAGARTFERRLPEVEGAKEPVVVLRLRGHTQAGATFVHVVSAFAGRLEEAGGRLYLSGVNPDALEHLERVAEIKAPGPESVYEAEPVLGRATREAYEEAEMWLVRQRRDGRFTGRPRSPSERPASRSD